MISIIILTWNDEIQIGNCLASVRDLSDDVTVVDSYSTDRTLEICRDFGAKVFQNPFINHGLQCNWALDNVPIKHDWILRLDSDMIVPDRLKDELRRRVGKEPSIVAYYLNCRIYWMGRWMRHGRMYPLQIVRLFKVGHARYEERTTDHLIVDGRIGYMKTDFFEDNKKNSLDYFTEKHLTYARGEAKEIQDKESGVSISKPSIEPSLFGAKPHRTRWLKEKLYARTPLFVRPLLYFFYRYFVCLGFLDGIPGLIWHVLHGFCYRFYIDAKVYEWRMAKDSERAGDTHNEGRQIDL